MGDFMAREFAESFYKSTTWQKCRDAFMAEKLWTCERCGAVAEIVHHKKYITPNNIDDPAITLSWDNLEALCRDCHNKEHFRAEYEQRYRFDANGNIVPTLP